MVQIRGMHAPWVLGDMHTGSREGGQTQSMSGTRTAQGQALHWPGEEMGANSPVK